MANSASAGRGCKTAGRSKRKAAARTQPLSRYVRGVITFEAYAKATGIKTKLG